MNPCGVRGVVTEQRLQRAMFVEGGSMAEEEDAAARSLKRSEENVLYY